MADINDVLEVARRLNLQSIAHGHVELEEKKDMSNLDYLHFILSQELEIREAKSFTRRERESKLPYRDFLKSRVNSGIAWQIEKLEEMQWLDEAQNLIIIGNCDTGKTSLASYLGRKALEKGEKVLYLNIAKFIDILRRKDKNDRVAKTFHYITTSSLIIIDDMMYSRIPDEDLPRLYQAITFLNETRSLIIITNRELSTWANGAEDEHMVNTLVSRLTSGSQILRLN